jgi:hypothetical protein
MNKYINIIIYLSFLALCETVISHYIYIIMSTDHLNILLEKQTTFNINKNPYN